MSTYFSANCEEGDAAIGGRFLDSIGLSPYNTRLFKSAVGVYTVRIASAATSSDGLETDLVAAQCKEHMFEGKRFVVQRGDYAPLMGRVVAALRAAIPHAANEQQTMMLERFVASFDLGSIEAHKDGSRCADSVCVVVLSSNGFNVGMVCGGPLAIFAHLAGAAHWWWSQHNGNSSQGC